MSFLSFIPLTEIFASFISSAVVVLTARDLLRSKNSAAIFAEALSKRREWREFESNRLVELLEDNQITDDDWKEIMSVVEDIVISDAKIKGWKELRSLYPARSEKAKKLLLSNVIKRSSQHLQSNNYHEATK